jgi:hypothetical protein
MHIVLALYYDARIHEHQVYYLTVLIPYHLHFRDFAFEYNVQFHPDPARKLSANLYDIYHCYVYSDKLLMMGRGTVRNM